MQYNVKSYEGFVNISNNIWPHNVQGLFELRHQMMSVGHYMNGDVGQIVFSFIKQCYMLFCAIQLLYFVTTYMHGTFIIFREHSMSFYEYMYSISITYIWAVFMVYLHCIVWGLSAQMLYKCYSIQRLNL